MEKQGFKTLMGALAALLCVLPLVAGQGHAAPGLAGSVLSMHNHERARLGLTGLQWSDRLAGDAAVWARKLAAEGQLRHASQQERAGAGENLWMSFYGHFDTETIVGTFLEEKALFVPGQFPRVSRSGRWQDVGHYTQVIWPQTREVGCATAEVGERQVMVCRYWPAGNWVGHTVG